MNINKYIIVIIFICFMTHARAQDSVQHSAFSFGAGIIHMADKDEFQSPYTYRGTIPALTATYIRSGKNAEHLMKLNYSSGRLAAIVAPKAENRLIQFDYAYLLRMHRNANNRFTPYVGVGIQALGSTLNYLPKIESPRTYVTAAASLTLRGKINYAITEKHHIKIEASLPLIGAAYRPDFDINGKSLTSFTHLGESGIYSAGIEYSYTLNRKLDLLAAYHYTYFNFPQPRPVTIMQNGLTVQLRIKL